MKRIDILPDDVLLEIFDFYVDMPRELLLLFEEDLFWQSLYHVCLWQSLVHVCRRWRYLVFGSPRRLNLRLRCTPERTTRDRLDVWPALPLAVYCYSVDPMIYVYYGTDHVIAALGQSNRVHDVHLCGLDSSDLEEVLAAMQVPFPELTRMSLSFDVRPVPDSFLGGSAPRLHSISGIAKAAFVSYSPCPTSPFQYSSIWVHLTRSDRRSPLRVVQPRKTFP